MVEIGICLLTTLRIGRMICGIENELLSERIIVPMSKSMVEAIIEYRFGHRVDTRADAIRRLNAVGLEGEKKEA